MSMLSLKELAQKHQEKLKKIKVVLFDVDGILTDGKVWWAGEEVGYNRAFHTSDGYMMRLLRSKGLKTGIISGGNSFGVKKRFADLGVDYIYLGDEDKTHALEKVIQDSKCSKDEILYMGDEFFDLPVLRQVGFSATAPHASEEIRKEVDYVTRLPAGMGCAREVMDLVRYSQDIYPDFY